MHTMQHFQLIHYFVLKKAGYNIRIAHSHSTQTPSNKKIKFFDLKWIYKIY